MQALQPLTRSSACSDSRGELTTIRNLVLCLLVMILWLLHYAKLRDASNTPQLQRNISGDKPNLLPLEGFRVTTLSRFCQRRLFFYRFRFGPHQSVETPRTEKIIRFRDSSRSAGAAWNACLVAAQRKQRQPWKTSSPWTRRASMRPCPRLWS
jgi:hypothetical protein